MLNSIIGIKIKSFIESEMSVPGGIRTHDLRVTAVKTQNFDCIFHNIDDKFIDTPLKWSTL